MHPLLSLTPHLSYSMDKSNQESGGKIPKTVHLSVHPK